MYKWQPTPSLFRALLDAEYQHQWVPPGIHILFLKMLLQAQSSQVLYMSELLRLHLELQAQEHSA